MQDDGPLEEVLFLIKILRWTQFGIFPFFKMRRCTHDGNVDSIKSQRV
jgi:hypothetical protein